MCKYCENLFMGNSNKFLSDAKVRANNVFIASVITFIGEDKNDKPVLCTVLVDNHAVSITSEEIAINWCPVCGRKL